MFLARVQPQPLTKWQRLWTVRITVGILFVGPQAALIWKAQQPELINYEPDMTVVLVRSFLVFETVLLSIYAAIAALMIGHGVAKRWIDKGQ